PTETAARSPHPAPPSPTPLPSATDNPWPPNSHTPPPLHWCRSVSTSHPCNTPAFSPPAATAHCTTSHSHTNPPPSPDDSAPGQSRQGRSHSGGSSPNNTLTAIDSRSPDSRPCKTPTRSR